MRFQFLGQAFGEGQIEGFGGSVGGDIRHRLERRRGSDDQDVPGPMRDHRREKQVRQMYDCGAIYVNHFHLPPKVRRRELAIGAEPGVVDQQIDVDISSLGEGEYFSGRRRVGQVSHENFRSDFVRRRKRSRQVFQPLAATRRQNQVRARRSQFFGQGFADAVGTTVAISQTMG